MRVARSGDSRRAPAHTFARIHVVGEVVRGKPSRGPMRQEPEPRIHAFQGDKGPKPSCPMSPRTSSGSVFGVDFDASRRIADSGHAMIVVDAYGVGVALSVAAILPGRRIGRDAGNRVRRLDGGRIDAGVSSTKRVPAKPSRLNRARVDRPTDQSNVDRGC